MRYRLDLALIAAAGFLALSPEMSLAQNNSNVSASTLALKAEYFARDPYMSPPQISPDGQQLAWISGNKIVIFNLNTEVEKTLPGGENALESVEWINNDYLVVYLKTVEEEKRTYTNVLGYSPLIVNKEGKFVRLLFENDGKKVVAADLKPIIRFVDAPEPYVITFGGNNTYITDVGTGKWKVGPRLFEGDVHYFDRNGQERMAVEFLDAKLSYGISSLNFRFKDKPGGKTQLMHLPKQANTYYTSYHYSEYDNSIYWSEFDYSKGVASIYRYDISSSVKTLYKTGQNKDMDVVIDKNGQLVGTSTVTDRIQIEWTDPYRLKLTRAVQDAFPNATVSIVDMTPDNKAVVFLIAAPEAPDSYYYYDTDSKDLAQIGVNFPELEDQALGEMSYVTYKARDGLDIPAYITKRKNTPLNAPLIVMPHGGPAARDVYGFDFMAQFLASRGYVVLQPQYRGSAGFGDAFQRAGNKNLDLMTNDLEDGVRFLSGKGMIDPAKVCVVGWSWGGYLAQAGLAFKPDLYACGVSGAGVSDLFESLNNDNDFWWGGYGLDYWRSVIGEQMVDGAKIHATSPIEHVDAIKAPMLLIHGESDTVVNVRQSERMNAAMKKAGKNVTYIAIKSMRHGPNDAAQRLTVLKAIDSFISDAFAGKRKN